MYTANTMATAIEALGMSLPYSSSSPSDSQEEVDECIQSGAAMLKLLEMDLKPRDIMTKAAFENAIRMVMMTGGSTNAVLHLIAMSRSCQDPNVAITLDDFQRISDVVSIDYWVFMQRRSTCSQSLLPGCCIRCSSTSQYPTIYHLQTWLRPIDTFLGRLEAIWKVCHGRRSEHWWNTRHDQVLD